jgi:RNA ligase (TIGR02306 family)
MGDWSPQIVKIEKVINHPNADSLDLVTVLGDYPVVVKRDEYKVNDLAAYLPIDTIVPDTDQYYFLCPKGYEKYLDDKGDIQQRQTGPKFPIGSVPEKYRVVKAKKIRDIYSQGMLVNISAISCATPSQVGDALCNNPTSAIGLSVVDVLGLKKLEEEEEDNITNAKKSKGANAGPSPKGWTIPHYDIEGLRKYINCLQEDEEIVLTEKIHGSNAAFCHDGEQLWVKSRNFYKKMDEDDPWWDIAIRYDLAAKLASFPMKVLFGELYGQIKGFRYDCELVNGAMPSKIRFFDIYDPVVSRYLNYDDFTTMISQAGLETAPLLYRGKWQGKEAMYPYAEGPTTLGGKHTREGFVLRTAIERFEYKLNSRMCIKLVGEGYNLAK